MNTPFVIVNVDARGQVSSFDPTASDNVVAGGLGRITHPKQLHNQDWNNFQPRVGVAWTFHPKWVYRTSRGI